MRKARRSSPASSRPGRAMARRAIFFSEQRGPARSAALVNGAAGHAHDYDDIGIAFHPAHPSVAMAPAIFAQAESMGASGKDVLCAFATAYEVWSELASRDKKPHHLRGFHPTGNFGTVAAAAGVARLLGLDAKRASNALAIAASQASGLVANFGSMNQAVSRRARLGGGADVGPLRSCGAYGVVGDFRTQARVLARPVAGGRGRSRPAPATSARAGIWSITASA